VSAGRLLTLGLGTPFSAVKYLPTLGLGISLGPSLLMYSGVSFPLITHFNGISRPTVSDAGVVTTGVSEMKADGVIKAEFLVNGVLP